MSERRTLRSIDGFTISAEVSEAPSDNWIVWLHGIAVDKDEYLGLFSEGARTLEEAGFSSLRFDFRGHGSSGGSSLDFSIVGQMLDIDAVVTYVKHHARPNASLCLIGASFGAPPAIFAALRYPDIVRSLALIAPVLSYQRTFLSPETDWARAIFNESSLQRLRQTGRLRFSEDFEIGLRLVEEMRLVRPDLALRDVEQPVLILHGDRDSMVPYSITQAICDDIKQIRLVTMNGVDHGHVVEGDDEGTSAESALSMRRIFELIGEHLTC